MIRFVCENCGQKFRVLEKWASKKGKCHKCGKIVVIPAINKTEDVTPMDGGRIDALEKASSIQKPRSSSDLPYNVIPTPTAEQILKCSLHIPLVFRPLLSITWPKRCVRCFAKSPSEKIKLSVKPATRETRVGKASLVGGLTGGIAGIIVGHAIGGASISSPGGTETSCYNLPICVSCLSLLPKKEIRALRGKKDGTLLSSFIDTSILYREIVRGTVYVTFGNARYAAAFREANKQAVFGSVKACRSGLTPSQIQEWFEKLDLAVLYDPDTAKSHSGTLRETILSLLRERLSEHALSVAPNILPLQLWNAVRACQVTSPEHILALVDFTALGSAKNCLLFGCKGIYFYNGKVAKRPGAGAIPYREFPNRKFTKAGWYTVALGQDQFLEIAGNVPKKTVLALLQSIKQCIISHS